MDWTVYWFMLPVCVVVATTAMFSGISGAALLTPFFVLGFPLMGVPTLSFVQAIGTSLFLETSGFGSGVAGYARRRLPDYRFVWVLLAIALPAGAVGAVLARHSPTTSVTMPNLVRRVGMPVPVAAATSVMVVAATVGGAATHAVQLVLEGGVDAIPWNLIVRAVPGAITGAQIGARLHGRIPERASNRFFTVLFTRIGLAFLGTAAREAGI